MKPHFLLYALALAAQCGCGASWGEDDLRASLDTYRLEATALDLCAPDGGDCPPGQVRALERAALCLSASTLYRHGHEVDAGVQCRPR